MDVAWGYIRISEEDQSNFSLTGQDSSIRKFCSLHNMRLDRVYVDECSAKNFDRPEWKKMERDLFLKKNNVDFLIVIKYDRLIRNVLEGLSFIEKLEKKWDIKLLSVMENFNIDPKSPFFFKMRVDLLVNAEFERLVISDRVKFGNWSAKSDGRFIGQAPFGYDNKRDEKDLPIIVINEQKRPIVEMVFRDYINGYNFPQIRQRLKEKGFMLSGHDALYRILTNHVYAGLIVTPAYKNDKQRIVKGIHEGTISENDFYLAYYKLQEERKPQGPKIIDDKLPLRGLIRCRSCDHNLTGAKSKGRSKYYYYYSCNTCRKEIYNAEQAHSELKELLGQLSLKSEYVKALQKKSDEELNVTLHDRVAEASKVKREILDLDRSIKGLEGKYIQDKINDETYKDWFDKFNLEIVKKRDRLAYLEKDDLQIKIRYQKLLPYLGDLNYLYEKADMSLKQPLLKAIFMGGLIKKKPGYRTAFLNPAFEQKAADNAGSMGLEITRKPADLAGFPGSTRKGT